MTDFEGSKNSKQIHDLCALLLQLVTTKKLIEPYMALLMQAEEGKKCLHQDACGYYVFFLGWKFFDKRYLKHF